MSECDGVTWGNDMSERLDRMMPPKDMIEQCMEGQDWRDRMTWSDMMTRWKDLTVQCMEERDRTMWRNDAIWWDETTLQGNDMMEPYDGHRDGMMWQNDAMELWDKTTRRNDAMGWQYQYTVTSQGLNRIAELCIIPQLYFIAGTQTKVRILSPTFYRNRNALVNMGHVAEQNWVPVEACNKKSV